jgi:hypothetical protein
VQLLALDFVFSPSPITLLWVGRHRTHSLVSLEPNRGHAGLLWDLVVLRMEVLRCLRLGTYWDEHGAAAMADGDGAPVILRPGVSPRRALRPVLSVFPSP